MFEVVTPAKAVAQEADPRQHWIPVFDGMTANLASMTQNF
jgi:hypothetical protein